MQSFKVASSFLDETEKIIEVWYTQKDRVSSFYFRIMQEQLENGKERDENISNFLAEMLLY